MKFDFCCGNPPYQDNTLGDNANFAPPVYNKFMDAAYEIADKVELIHPARFLFNAGSTPKEWNEKMLNDSHFKILHYEQDSSKVFANTDIKGGVCISYHEKNKEFGAIEIFTPSPILNSIVQKVRTHKFFHPFSTIVISRYAYHFTEMLYKDYPELSNRMSKGHQYDLKSNVFSKMPEPFFIEKPKDDYSYIRILGRENNTRIYRFIRKEYITDVPNLSTYKVFLPGASGIGEFGEVLAPPIVGEPFTGATETFMGIGSFDTYNDTEHTILYIKSKFARALLGVLKRTQMISVDVWKYIPLQDFSNNSDIDWSVSIANIDRQLYKKYNLSQDEIDFIETHVKEME